MVPTEQSWIFNESHAATLVSPSGAEGKEWDVVLIRPGLSRNGNFYPADVLRKAAPLFEGVRACAYRFGDPLGKSKFNHLPERASFDRPGGFAENVVGWFTNVRYEKFKDVDGKEAEGLVARFHVLEGAEWLRKNLRDAWQHNRYDLLGFSIDAKGKARDQVINGRTVKMVERIDEVRSTDVVTDPAAGGGVVRLVASLEGEMPEPKVENVLAMIQEHRPAWIESYEKIAEGEDVQDYLYGLLETVLVKGEDYQKGIDPSDGKHLAEVARGIVSMNSLILMLREGKLEDAIKLIQAWITEHAMPEKDKPEEADNREGFISYPSDLDEFASRNTPQAAGAQQETIVKESTMDQPITTPTPPALDDETKAKLARLEELEKQKEEDEKARTALAEERAKVEKEKRDNRISARVKESGLPEVAQTRVRDALIAREGEVADEDVDKAVASEKEYMDTLTEGKPNQPVVRDLGNAHGDRQPVEVTQDQRDKYSRAFDGLFEGGVSRIDGVEPFRSLHEAFGTICGQNLHGYVDREAMADYIFAGIKMAFPSRSRIRCMENHITKLKEGWSPYQLAEQADLREAIGTGDFPVAFGDALFRRLQKEFAAPELNDWRKIVSSIENLTDLNNDFNIVRIGMPPIMPVVAEKAPYQEVNPEPTEAVEKLTPEKRGYLFKLTWEDMLADRIGVIRAIPRQLGRTAARTIQQIVWDQIETNPTLDADSVALINATHNNLVATNPALSFADVVTAIRQLRDQTEQDSGEKLGLDPAFLLVSPQREATAVEITGSNVKVTGAEDSTVINFVRRLGVDGFPTIGLGRTTTPTDTRFRWYVAASPKDAETIVVGFLGGRDRPDLFVQSPVDTPTAGAAFESDALTFKSRLGVGAKVADFRWIVGSLATS